MRYRNIPQVPFVNVFGEAKNLHVTRPENITAVVGEVDLIEGMELDEVANKVFGSGSETISYRIRDQNVKTLLFNDYEVKKIKKLEIGDTI